MTDVCKTVKVAALDAEQGDHVVINECDYDPATHTLLDDDASEDGDEKAEKAALVDEIVSLGGEKPHHATGVAKLRETLAALKAAE